MPPLDEQKQILKDEAPGIYPADSDAEGLAKIERELALAAIEIGSFLAGDPIRDKVVALLTAHVLTLRGRAISAGATGASGAIVSESEGQRSRSYAQPGDGGTEAMAAYYSSTVFGQEFMRITRARIFAPMTSVADVPGWYW